jgi:hypothetical protein
MPSYKVHLIIIVSLLSLKYTIGISTENQTVVPVVIEADASGGGATEAAEDVDLLKWALKHSDPESLHEKAEADKKGNKHDPDAAERRARATELLKAVNSTPSEGLLMEEAVLVLQNDTSTSTIEDKLSALEALIVLVEPIDNANDLLKIPNGTFEINRLLGSAPGLEAAAARVLGVAASNNDLFSNELIQRHPDVILRLVQLLSASADDTVAAAVYAAGQLLRNSGHARSLWKQASGNSVLIAMIRGGNKQISERSRKKALSLVGDLILLDNAAFGDDRDSLVAVLLDVVKYQCTVENNIKIDLDLVEKALLALQAATRTFHSHQREVLESLIKKLKLGDENGHVAEYEADVVALAEQLLSSNTKASSEHRPDEL